MFDKNNRYMTKGIQSEIPLGLQLFLWNCIDVLILVSTAHYIRNSQNIKHSKDLRGAKFSRGKQWKT